MGSSAESELFEHAGGCHFKSGFRAGNAPDQPSFSIVCKACLANCAFLALDRGEPSQC